jgi:cystathionine gamma-synthase
LTEEEERDNFHSTFGSVSFPIFQTAAYVHPGIRDDYVPGQDHISLSAGYNYSRESNPTRTQLEKFVAQLEGGAGALAFSSGMAAITLLFELFEPGDQVIVDVDLYGGSVRFFNEIARRHGIRFISADFTKEDVAALMTPETKAIYFETPTNPMARVSDIAKLAALARRNGSLCIVDNTYLSPYFQNPLALGADVVIHSGTKFLAGHHDVIAGFLVASDPTLVERLRFLSTTTGSALAPFDSWLVLRGIKTLSLRMERSQENAFKIVEWLQSQSHVKSVFFPGLPNSPGYAVMKRQARGFGSMVSFEVESKELAIATLTRVKTIFFAESLGGTETLLTYPIAQTHASVSAEGLRASGLNDRILRLSVGIESARDLIADLDHALNG